jgi:heme/copper-type cytochrome/quinol oxidase subunit 2
MYQWSPLAWRVRMVAMDMAQDALLNVVFMLLAITALVAVLVVLVVAVLARFFLNRRDYSKRAGPPPGWGENVKRK